MGESKANKIVILLSATIKPFMETFMAARSIEEREEDYFKAAEFYLGKGFPVVFVENSMYHSERIFNLKNRFPEFEILQFESTSSHLGKGHGEKQLMDYALANSTLLAQSEYLLKITGRYIVQNIQEFIGGLETDMKPVYINFLRDLTWGDTRILLMSKAYYKEIFAPFCDQYLDEKNNVILERVFARSVHHHMSKGGTFGFWPVYPSYLGFDGSYGDPIKFSFFKKMKYQYYFKLKRFIFKHIA
ncbi:hypothetical protein [Algoriphagus machipongonensis]|uniref:Uncharacterized protein n=1 Tax=Algoriphagus machipongonensis TaxID=388413 RepID=A3I1Y7_9BACT|nr:hypothetical protein [Algoriphagus machipongonensis]EAZ79803.1 hypothetical protein ALPR1_09263 [Algoriphagus machipongonensis]